MWFDCFMDWSKINIVNKFLLHYKLNVRQWKNHWPTRNWTWDLPHTSLIVIGHLFFPFPIPPQVLVKKHIDERKRRQSVDVCGGKLLGNESILTGFVYWYNWMICVKQKSLDYLVEEAISLIVYDVMYFWKVFVFVF